MTERIIIAGAGGQGIMLLGKVLATAAMKEDKFVTWLPAYGAEVRGGTSHCAVIISDREVGSPYIQEADTLIAMNGPSLLKFKNRLKNKGLLIINSSLADAPKKENSRIFDFPFTGIAAKLGNIKIANMVALGAYAQASKTVTLRKITDVIAEMAPVGKEDLVKINQQALKEGAGLVNG